MTTSPNIEQELINSVQDFYQSEISPQSISSLSAASLLNLWQQSIDMGLSLTLLTEAQDGLGLEAIHAAQLAEETGKHLYPLPISDAIVLSTIVIDRLHEMPPKLSTALHQWLGGKQLLAMVRPHNVIEYTAGCSEALELTWHNGMLQLSLYPCNSTTNNMDPTLGATSFNTAAYSAIAQYQMPFDEKAWRRITQLNTLLRLGELIGTSQQAHQIAVAYAKEREQFNRPIGSNQAIKHTLADQWMAIDHARLALHDACLKWQQSAETELEFALNAAYVLTIEMAKDVTAYSIQVHGALGITWECNIHLYFKRAQHHCLFLSQEHSIPKALEGMWLQH